jgi:hypothetical protein
METLRNAILRGAELQPFELSDLSPQFATDLKAVCEAHAILRGVWLLWLSYPDAVRELLASVKVDQPDEKAINRFVDQVNSLDGPDIAVSISNGTPSVPPFYVRPEQG